jgi:hypothetical protein
MEGSMAYLSGYKQSVAQQELANSAPPSGAGISATIDSYSLAENEAIGGSLRDSGIDEKAIILILSFINETAAISGVPVSSIADLPVVTSVLREKIEAQKAIIAACDDTFAALESARPPRSVETMRSIAATARSIIAANIQPIAAE